MSFHFCHEEAALVAALLKDLGQYVQMARIAIYNWTRGLL